MKENDLPGTFIVIEGPDSAGKQTQAGRLVKWLRGEDFGSISEEEELEVVSKMPGRYPVNSDSNPDSIENGVWKLSFPSYSQTPGGRVVKAYLNGRLGTRDDLSVEDIVDIYAADRKQFKYVIAEYLEKGGIIVCDRYREANLIHQLVGFEGEEWHEKRQRIKQADSDLPDPDAVFYLNISPAEMFRRMESKDKDMHELNEEYMRASNRNGLKVAEHEDWSIFDGERSRDEIQQDLRASARQHF
ncbi:MAG: dTMP kinase [Candidatus Nanohaloarchaea archaeon]